MLLFLGFFAGGQSLGHYAGQLGVYPFGYFLSVCQSAYHFYSLGYFSVFLLVTGFVVEGLIRFVLNRKENEKHFKEVKYVVTNRETNLQTAR